MASGSAGAWRLRRRMVPGPVPRSRANALLNRHRVGVSHLLRYEMALLYGAVAFALALTGPGAWSADAALGLSSLWTPGLAWIALAIGLAGGAANLLARRSAPAAEVAPA